MRGWVYVATMTNTIGVVKIGYSERDPDLRGQEWARTTGAVGEAKVEYAAWVNEPREYETRVHKLLADRRQKGSEWFKCEVQAAIEAIHKSGTPLIQNHRTDNEKFEVGRAHKSEVDELREKLANSESISESRYRQLNQEKRGFDRKAAEFELKSRAFESSVYGAKREVLGKASETNSLRLEVRRLGKENTELKIRIENLRALNADLGRKNAELKASPKQDDISADDQSEVALISCSVCSLQSIIVSCPFCEKKHRLPAFERASGTVRCRNCSRGFDVNWKGDKVSTRARRETDSP